MKWKQFQDMLESPAVKALGIDQFLLFEFNRGPSSALVLRTASGIPPQKNLLPVDCAIRQELDCEPGVWFLPDVLQVTNSLASLAALLATLDGKSAFIARVNSNGAPWGVLVGCTKEPRTVDTHALSMFSLLASNASLLVENVQLRYGPRFRLSEALSLETVSSALVKGDSLDNTLALIIDEAVRLLNAQEALVLLLEDGGEWFQVRECLGSDLNSLIHRRLSVRDSLNGMVVMTGEPLTSLNTQTDPRADRLRARNLNVHDAVIAPLMIRGRILGTIAIHNKNSGHFSEEDSSILCSYANQAAIAIENAQLFSDLLSARNETQMKAQELQELLVQMMNIQEKERCRIAADFHDRVVSQIVGTLYEVESCIQLNNTSQDITGKLEQLKQMLNEAVEQTRRSIYNLWPATLDHMSLIPALHEMFKQQEKITGLSHTIHIHGTPYQLRSDAQIILYRIVQEAMNNAYRHSAATSVNMSIRFGPQQLSIKVRDNGRGFDVQRVMELPLTCHYGLILMKERARSVGGTLTIKSELGKGSQVTLDIPNIEDLKTERSIEYAVNSFANC